MFTLIGGCILREREWASMTTLFKSQTPFLWKTQTKPWYFLSWVCILAENQTFEWCCLIAEVLAYFFFYSWCLSLLFKYRGLIFKADWQFDTTQSFYSHSLLFGFVPYKFHLSKYKYTLQIIIFLWEPKFFPVFW